MYSMCCHSKHRELSASRSSGCFYPLFCFFFCLSHRLYVNQIVLFISDKQRRFANSISMTYVCKHSLLGLPFQAFLRPTNRWLRQVGFYPQFQQLMFQYYILLYHVDYSVMGSNASKPTSLGQTITIFQLKPSVILKLDVSVASQRITKLFVTFLQLFSANDCQHKTAMFEINYSILPHS